MHELSIADSIVRIATEHANGRRVTKVYLTVGHLRQVVPSALTFGFELISQGTPVEGAELEMTVVPAAGTCRVCATETRLQSFPLQCGECGGLDMDVVAGEELYVKSLELEEPAEKKLTAEGRQPKAPI